MDTNKATVIWTIFALNLTWHRADPQGMSEKQRKGQRKETAAEWRRDKVREEARERGKHGMKKKFHTVFTVLHPKRKHHDSK